MYPTSTARQTDEQMTYSTITAQRPGKTGPITYVIFVSESGRPFMASSCYYKEDGLGGIDECNRTLDPNGPTVSKIFRELNV